MGAPPEVSANPAAPGGWRRWLRFLRPSHQHTAFTATLLLMSAIMASRVIGYVREAYIAWAFGAGPQTDAYVTAFTIPDWLNYILAGGAASITFITIFTRFLSRNQQDEAEETYSVIITIMSTVLIAGIVLLEIFTPELVRLVAPGFRDHPQQLQLCVYLTRVLLPAQLFFYVGGVMSAVLLSRKLFLVPALAPLFYNAGIIAGGVILAHRLGIASLAYGALAGAFAGPFLINAIGAHRTGIRYRLSFDIRNAAFREWMWLSIPLMLGVSLATADDWILRFFASHGRGDITRLNYAKALFKVPIAVLAQATGQASLPFFASLWGAGRKRDFAGTVNASVYRLMAASVLGSAWMMAVALPLVDLVYRRGHFHFTDSQETAALFFWFAISLALWSAQALYARAFYAAGDTLTPMLSATVVTLASLPLYWVLFKTLNVVGLAIASDTGIFINTVALAMLLHWKKLVPVSGLNWKELGKAAATALLAGVTAVWAGRQIPLQGSRLSDLESFALGSVVWLAVTAAGLWLTRSTLAGDLRRRPAAAPAELPTRAEP